MEDNNGNMRQESETREKVEAQNVAVEDKQASKKKKSAGQEIREWLVALAAALVIVFLINSFLFRIIRVGGHSMDNTLSDGERLFVTVTDVRFSDLHRDDVVICHYPGRGFTFFVKRCVALPGDTLYCENGVTHVVYEQDGQTVDEALDERYAFYYGGPTDHDYEPYTLGEDEYFVVGDNRYNSHDSRDWNGPEGVGGGNDGSDSNNVGPISKKKIVGHVREVIWPLNAIRPVE